MATNVVTGLVFVDRSCPECEGDLHVYEVRACVGPRLLPDRVAVGVCPGCDRMHLMAHEAAWPQGVA